jgi:uncharacterized repeat protein (TIGR01451 family)
MNTATNAARHACALLLAGTAILAGHAAFADEAARNCVQLHNDVQMEQKYVDADGRAATRLVPPSKVIPGTVMVYTITARNGCTAASERVVITNPVPEHMQYVGGSATRESGEPLYSVDTRAFARLEALAAQSPDGASRPARNEDIRSIRWTLSQGLAAGQSLSVQFRATVQ